MDISQAHLAFKIKLDKTSSLEYPSFTSEEIDFWLNDAIITFVKQRAQGITLDKSGVEENQKRIDDLRSLIVLDSSLKSNLNTYYENSKCFDLPDDYFRYLGDQVTISGTSITEHRVGTTPATTDIFNIKYLEDPYSKHILHHQTAKPLRMLRDDEIVYVTDGNYVINDCYLSYIKKPVEVNLATNTSSDLPLPENVHDEIINIAVRKVLENIESSRYQSFTGETLTIE